MAEQVAQSVERVITKAAGNAVEHVAESIGLVQEPLFNFGLPTLEKPFGVSLFPIFRAAVEKVSGYDVATFKYEFNSDVPLSTVPQVTIAIAAYYIIIFGGREVLRAVKPIKINPIFKLHNLILTLLSLTLLLLLVEQILPIVVNHGVFYAICNAAAWTQKIELIYYLNYLTKYYEFFDTLFLVLRHRPLTFLHTYHHGATALLCFSQLNGYTSVSWIPISLNLGVHVLMYFYYFLSACGIRPWWKHWVTRFQIIQFVIDLVFVYFASYTYFVSKYWPHLPNYGTCAGAESAALNGCLILTSYLVLFISFYIKVYLTPSKKSAAAPKAVAAAEEAATAVATGAAAPAKKTKSRRV